MTRKHAEEIRDHLNCVLTMRAALGPFHNDDEEARKFESALKTFLSMRPDSLLGKLAWE